MRHCQVAPCAAPERSVFWVEPVPVVRLGLGPYPVYLSVLYARM